MRNAICILAAIALAGCSSFGSATRPDNRANVLLAEGFIDAFYSFDSSRLKRTLTFAEKSKPQIVYYQGWAEGGNYKIVNRMPCNAKSAQEVTCAITVKDDLVIALGIPFDVTDTFHISLRKGKIRTVTNSSNDPKIYHDAQKWVKRERPELIRVPCEGFFNGGPTPGKCAQAMARGYAEFAARGT